MSTMTESLMLAHTQTSVQQEHALLSPSRQVATLGYGSTCLSLNLLEDVLKRGRKLHPIIHTEAEPVCLIRFMIRVLPQDNHPHLIKRSSIKGIEYQFSRRVTNAGAILRANELCQFLKVWLLKFFIKTSLPALFNPYIH